MLIQEAIGKIILSGEHAVVYGYPAIALPVRDCKTKVFLKVNSGNNNDIIIKAKQINKTLIIKPNENKKYFDPLELTVLNFFNYCGITLEKGFTLDIISDIPVSSGMGSGAAIALSMIRVLADFYKISLSNEEIYNLVFETEKIYHGNPSGIDTKVIIYEKPVYYIRNKIMEIFDFKAHFAIAIIDSGIKSSTKKAVDWVAEQRKNNPEKYESIFNKIASITQNIKKALEENNISNIGQLMSHNHFYLQEIGVSNQTLDELVNIAVKAGALGSKLSGAGLGGIVIALLEKDRVENFQTSLKSMGVKNFRLTFFGCPK